MRLLPELTVVRQRGIGMGGDLCLQRGFLRGGHQPWSSRARTGQAGAGALANPAANRGGIVLEERGDVSNGMPRIAGSPCSLTDVVGGVRAFHPISLPRRHNFCKLL